MKLNAADGTVLGVFKAGDGAAGVTVNQGRVLIVNNGSNSIITLSTEGALLSTAIVGRSPFAVVSDGTYAWVTNSGSNSVSKR
jgi:DNA-binding beta-propeller fold protein YncE